MKIHGPGPFGPIGPGGDSNTGRAKANESFSVDSPAKAAPFTPPAGATRADLDNPARMRELLAASVKSMLDASPVGAAVPPERRAELEAHLASDPMMRDLLTRLLEGTLR